MPVFPQHPLHKKQQLRLAEFLDELAEAEAALESIKLQLQNTPQFSPQSLFDRIAQEKNSITLHQLKQYLGNGISLNERELYDIFCKFDRSRAGLISRSDFLQQILPNSVRNPSKAQNTKLHPSTQALFIELLSEAVSRFRVLEICRKDLEEVLPYMSFDQIAVQRTGSIGVGQLRAFMSKNDMPINQEKGELLLSALKRRAYNKVTLQVWCEDLCPLQFGYYEKFDQYLRNYEEQSYLRRSRNEEETARQLRLDSQRATQLQMKRERRIIADLEKQREHEQHLAAIINGQKEEELRALKRSQLQDQKHVRFNMKNDQTALEEEAARARLDRLRLDEAEAIKARQLESNIRLKEATALNLQDIDESRRRLVEDNERLAQDRLRQQIQRTRLAEEELLLNERDRVRSDLILREEESIRMRELQSKRLFLANKTFYSGLSVSPHLTNLYRPTLDDVQPYRRYRDDIQKRSKVVDTSRGADYLYGGANYSTGTSRVRAAARSEYVPQKASSRNSSLLESGLATFGHHEDEQKSKLKVQITEDNTKKDLRRHELLESSHHGQTSYSQTHKRERDHLSGIYDTPGVRQYRATVETPAAAPASYTAGKDMPGTEKTAVQRYSSTFKNSRSYVY